MNKYPVLLLYPDTGADHETYYGWVEADNPDEAVGKAREKALEANPDSEWEPEDFEVLGVFKGHIRIDGT